MSALVIRFQASRRFVSYAMVAGLLFGVQLGLSNQDIWGWVFWWVCVALVVAAGPAMLFRESQYCPDWAEPLCEAVGFGGVMVIGGMIMAFYIPLLLSR